MTIRWSHLPTYLLLIGYATFWLELSFHTGSHTSPAACVLFALFTFLAWWSNQRQTLATRPRDDKTDAWFLTMLFVGIGILALSFFEACLPPHLTQEFDALNYHYALPRQHLILGSFAHLPWSVADLWLLPIQFALSPYWFVTRLPNKIPQFIFLIGLIAITWQLGNRFSDSKRLGWLVAAAVIGSHGLSIQFGTAMLDIVITYLFIAAIDSILHKEWFLAASESAFWFWSRSFIPIQAVLMAGGIYLCGFMVGRQQDVSNALPRPFWVAFVCLSLFIGGPFIGKGLFYAGTPLPPFGVLKWGGTLAKAPEVCDALKRSSTLLLQVKDQYGLGRGLKAFLKHFWLLGVPQNGVNNAFDYPLGLPYLLALGPFCLLAAKDLWFKTFSPATWAVTLWWMTWWMGSQQSRWLYIPLIGMFLVVFSREEIASNPIVRTGLLLSLSLTCLSLARAYRSDFSAFQSLPLRVEDKALYDLSQSHTGRKEIKWHSREIAYAECPVVVDETNAIWVLPKER
jgi:hypothetical protein